MGAWTELVDYTWAANETSRTFSGLNITKDDFIKIILSTAGTGSSQFALFPNTAAGVSGNTTLTNYHRQAIFTVGTSISASRNNTNVVDATATNAVNSASVIYAKISENGKWNTFANYLNRDDSSHIVAFDYTTSSNLTFSNTVTSITLTSSTASRIGTGSRIQIYRLDAEKVADITTTANATQVDISSLSIGKDSEYLLVSDISNSYTASGIGYNIFPNDLTTETNYYVQSISGNDTTASAARTNAAFAFANSSIGGKSIHHTHIKLSEIGAFTVQSYSLNNYGISSPLVRNSFVSSTSEAITSITKLTIRTAFSEPGIGSGSRFILYKLK
jgi:hypothetical protein